MPTSSIYPESFYFIVYDMGTEKPCYKYLISYLFTTCYLKIIFHKSHLQLLIVVRVTLLSLFIDDTSDENFFISQTLKVI